MTSSGQGRMVSDSVVVTASAVMEKRPPQLETGGGGGSDFRCISCSERRMTPDVQKVKTWVDEADRVTVLTGAGISTDSGIPDFRGPNGVWTKNPAAERTATLQHYLAEPETRKAAWRSRIDSPMFDADPNSGHRAIADLERTGRLIAVITQNVDGLHQKAGSNPDHVYELHGNAHRVKCWSCGEEAPMERALAPVRA